MNKLLISDRVLTLFTFASLLNGATNYTYANADATTNKATVKKKLKN